MQPCYAKQKAILILNSQFYNNQLIIKADAALQSETKPKFLIFNFQFSIFNFLQFLFFNKQKI